MSAKASLAFRRPAAAVCRSPARSVAGTRRHEEKAVAAASQALLTSCADAFGTEPMGSFVAGSVIDGSTIGPITAS
ncbi:MAG: hypothetical protein BMS9Abin12_0217 [Acidimicrobiia bacterium]|nr:MAG: hypothetical protein BMS9Abin12_0217 [Acidimicrobiia bacterium]